MEILPVLTGMLPLAVDVAVGAETMKFDPIVVRTLVVVAAGAAVDVTVVDGLAAGVALSFGVEQPTVSAAIAITSNDAGNHFVTIFIHPSNMRQQRCRPGAY